MEPLRPLRDLFDDLAAGPAPGWSPGAGPTGSGAGEPVEAQSVLDASGYAELPADLVASALVSYASTAPLEVAEQLAPFVTAHSGVPDPAGAGVEVPELSDGLTLLAGATAEADPFDTDPFDADPFDLGPDDLAELDGTVATLQASTDEAPDDAAGESTQEGGAHDPTSHPELDARFGHGHEEPPDATEAVDTSVVLDDLDPDLDPDPPVLDQHDQPQPLAELDDFGGGWLAGGEADPADVDGLPHPADSDG